MPETGKSTLENTKKNLVKYKQQMTFLREEKLHSENHCQANRTVSKMTPFVRMIENVLPYFMRSRASRSFMAFTLEITLTSLLTNKYNKDSPRAVG